MRRFALLVLALAAGCGHPSGLTPPDGGPPDGGARVWPPSDRVGYVSPILAENQQPGDTDLVPTRHTYGAQHQIEGYADRVSANAGDTVQVMVNADVAGHNATWQLYRVGWYGGAGARKVPGVENAGSSFSLPVQPACSNNTTTGLVRCAWPATFSFKVPAGAVSGIYLIKLMRDDNFGSLVPLVVKDSRPADLLFQSSVTTFEAYNKWGGESLYFDADDGISGHKAVQVSFDRPYASYDGTADLLRWETSFARYLERSGYDVTYSTNLDLVREGAPAVQKRGAFLSVGHDEYWPIEQRPLMDAARDAGVPLLFFTANPAYWRTRLSDPGADGNARVLTCYKQFPQNDPMAGTPQATGRFRDPPFNNSEEKLIGVAYDSYMLFGQPWTVDNGNHFLYAGTGLSTGDLIPNLIGYEYDRTFDHGTPSAVTRVARSPIIDVEGKPGLHESTIYTAPGGAIVFGAGTIYWSLGLDGPLRDGRVERMTANLIHGALPSVPVPAALQSVSAPAINPPQPSWATDVRTIAQGGGFLGPAGVTQLPDGTLVVADPRAHRLWSVSGSGSIAPFAGDGNPTGSTAYDNRPGLSARFFGPAGVLADSSGNVYVADTHNHVIRKIANDSSRTTTTLAGTFGNSDFADGTGAAARFNQPMALAWQDAAHLLVADSGNAAIRVVTVATGSVTTLARGQAGSDSDGPGLNTCGATDYTCQAGLAHFQNPTAVAAAPDGRVFFVASFSSRLKVVGTDSAHTVTSLTSGGGGFRDGAGTSAQLLAQLGLVYSGGALYLADTGNLRIRKVVPGADAASTTVTTWAGSGKTGSGDGSASTASIGLPLGMAVGNNGNVYVVDGDNLSVRAIRP